MKCIAGGRDKEERVKVEKEWKWGTLEWEMSEPRSRVTWGQGYALQELPI